MANLSQSWDATESRVSYLTYLDASVPGSTVVNIYVKENGSTTPRLIATGLYKDIAYRRNQYNCGQNVYGIGGVEIVGYTDGIEWDSVQWATKPSASSIYLVRTSQDEVSVNGTNRVNYVGAEQSRVAEYRISHNGHYFADHTFDELPFTNELMFIGGYDTVAVSIEVWSQTGGSGIHFYSAETSFKVQEGLSDPLAPTITSSPGSVVLTGSQSSVSWSPNHPDLTAQLSAQVKIDSTTYNVPGSVTTYKIPSSVMRSVGSHTISVRTQNALNQSWGPWSSTVTFQVRDLPSLVVSSPTNGYVLTDLPLIVTWDASDVTGISQQTVEILNSLGSTAWQTSVPVGTMNLAIGRNQYYLESGQAYSVRVTVTNGVNLSSSVTVLFTVLYVGPPNPEATIKQGAGCSMSVTVSFVSASGKPDVDTADVYRVDQFGGQTLIGTVSESGSSVLDPLPPLNVDFSYRAVAFAASGASTAMTADAHVDSGGMEAWNFGPSASTAILLGLNASGSRSAQFSGETFHFALGPDTPALPTFYPDGDLDATGSHSYVVHGVEDYLLVRSVVEDPNSAVCWFRDAFGGRHTVHASWQTGYDSASYDLFTVTASATEVVWEEPTS